MPVNSRECDRTLGHLLGEEIASVALGTPLHILHMGIGAMSSGNNYPVSRVHLWWDAGAQIYYMSDNRGIDNHLRET